MSHASGSKRWTRDEQYASGSCGPPEALATFRDGLVGDRLDALRTDRSAAETEVGLARQRRADRDEEAKLLGLRNDMLSC